MQQATSKSINTPFETIEVHPISGSVGAIVNGVDLSKLTDAEFDEIAQALLAHQVIFFRDQELELDAYLDFAKRWGKIALYPYMKGLVSHPEILQIVKNPTDTYAFGNAWHTDSSFLPIPPKLTMLHALEVPDTGGDTLFASLYHAYDTLSDGMRELLDGLRVLNIGDQPLQRFSEVESMSQRDPGEEKVRAHHPVIRTHPETGRKALYIGHHTVEFEGMTSDESAPLIKFLIEHATQPEFTGRFSWEPNSMAIWDNRCVLHYAIDDYFGQQRRMNRIIIEGDETPF